MAKSFNKKFLILQLKEIYEITISSFLKFPHLKSKLNTVSYSIHAQLQGKVFLPKIYPLGNMLNASTGLQSARI